MGDPVDDFVVTLAELGFEPNVEAQLVSYQIEPVDGTYAGVIVSTAVETAELARWPLVPPHWIHLPNTIVFSHTNSQHSTRPGWTKHSRQIKRWGLDPNPAIGWAAHVRSVIGAATT